MKGMSKEKSRFDTPIGKLRERSGLSQSEFAKKFHINVNTLRRWELGNSPTPESILYMVDYILDLEEDLYD